MDYVGNTYFKVKGEIIQCEKYLMKALGVCVHVQHPHKVNILRLTSEPLMLCHTADHHISSSIGIGKES